MWLLMTLGSAFFLGIYDIFKKKALERNGVIRVLLVSTAISTLFLFPFLTHGSFYDHARMMLKAVFVSVSWVSGLVALKYLPITTASTLKATRPFFVVIFSIILFAERLNLWQWGGVALALAAIMMLSVSSKREGIRFAHNKGFAAMAVSVVSGVVSALYDKYIISDFDPLFLQAWSDFYTTVCLAVCIIVSAVAKGWKGGFKWDWNLLLISVFITGADMLYFLALKQEASLLSVVSLLRRCSVIVTFVIGALVFKENRIKEKALELAVLLLGMVLLLYGS